MDVDAAEQCLVEQPALVVVALAVQLLRAGEQLQAGLHQADAVRQLILDTAKALLDALALVGDLAELLADPAHRHGAVGGEIEQVALTRIEACQFGGQLVLQQLSGVELVGHHQRDLFADVGDELFAESQAVVVPFDGVLDAGDAHVGAGALLSLLVAAEVVQVHVAVAGDVVLDR